MTCKCNCQQRHKIQALERKLKSSERSLKSSKQNHLNTLHRLEALERRVKVEGAFLKGFKSACKVRGKRPEVKCGQMWEQQPCPNGKQFAQIWTVHSKGAGRVSLERMEFVKSIKLSTLYRHYRLVSDG